MTNNLSTSLPSAWIDRLFSRLALAYGNKFADMWRDQDVASVKQMWANELAGYTADELRLALETMRTSNPTWPPTLYEFMGLCRPQPAAINHEAAFYEAIRAVEARKRGEMGVWSSRAIYWAVIDVSAFDVLGMTWPQIKGRWTKALDMRMADGNLPPIPEVMKQLPEPPRIKTGEHPELDRIADNVGKSARFDRRAWVRKILERKAANDSTLSDIAYRMVLASEKIR